MSCLTKKSLFFLVLSIVCNSTLSDITEECIANASKVFLPHNDKDGVFVEFMPSWFYFRYAMLLLSQSVFDLVSPEKLFYQLKNSRNIFERYSQSVIDSSTNTIHQSIFDEGHYDTLWLICLTDKFHKSDSNNFTCSESEKKNIIGYFRSLVSKLDNVADDINAIAKSPKQFCENYTENKYLLCRNALYALLSLRGSNSKTKIDDMKGYNAFKYCYLNYTYADYSLTTFFSALDSFDDSQSEEQNVSESSSSSDSSINQDKSNKLFQMVVLGEYFAHMFYVSTQIAELNEKNGLKLFPTVEEYCMEEADKSMA